MFHGLHIWRKFLVNLLHVKLYCNLVPRLFLSVNAGEQINAKNIFMIYIFLIFFSKLQLQILFYNCSERKTYMKNQGSPSLCSKYLR